MPARSCGRKASAKLAYPSYGTDPRSVLGRDLEWLLSNRDPRYATPTPAELDAATPEGFRKVWEPLLKQGPVEVDVFGDVDDAAVDQALNSTFGALPPRQPIPAGSAGARAVVPRADRAAGRAAPFRRVRPGRGGDRLADRRRLGDAARKPQARTARRGVPEPPARRDAREGRGELFAAGAVDAGRSTSTSGGRLMAMTQLPPQLVPEFFAAADKIAADLAATGPTADELARATEPLRQLLNRLETGHTFWLNQLEGATTDPNRVAHAAVDHERLHRIDPGRDAARWRRSTCSRARRSGSKCCPKRARSSLDSIPDVTFAMPGGSA